MNRQSLIGYRNGQGFIYNLSAVSKLLFFLAFSVVAMVTYDTRLVIEIFLYCSCCFDFFNDHSSQSVCIKFE